MTKYRVLAPEELAKIAKAPFQRGMMILPDGTPAVPIDEPQIFERPNKSYKPWHEKSREHSRESQRKYARRYRGRR